MEKLFEKAEGQDEKWSGREVGATVNDIGTASGNLWVSGHDVPRKTLAAGENTERQ